MNKCVVIPAYGSSDFFWGSAVPCFRSLRYHNPNIDVVLMYDGLTADQLNIFRGCECIHVNRGEFSVSHRPDLTEATFFKFHLNLLRHYDRALWLDTDTIVLANLAPLFSYDAPLAARFQVKPWEKEFDNPELVFRDYGLSATAATLQGGILCFDVSFWVSEGILPRAVEIGNRYGWDFFRNADQGILNILAHSYGGCGQYLDSFNYCRYHDMIRRNASIYPGADGVVRAKEENEPLLILHWNGRPKPYEILGSKHVARGNELRTIPCFQQFYDKSMCEMQ